MRLNSIIAFLIYPVFTSLFWNLEKIGSQNIWEFAIVLWSHLIITYSIVILLFIQIPFYYLIYKKINTNIIGYTWRYILLFSACSVIFYILSFFVPFEINLLGQNPLNLLSILYLVVFGVLVAYLHVIFYKKGIATVKY